MFRRKALLIILIIVAAATLAFLAIQHRKGRDVTEIGVGYLLISLLFTFFRKAATEEQRPEFAVAFIIIFVVLSALLVASYLFESRTSRRHRV